MGYFLLIAGVVLLTGGLVSLVMEKFHPMYLVTSACGVVLIVFGVLNLLGAVDRKNNLIEQVDTAQLTGYIDVDKLFTSGYFVMTNGTVLIWEDETLIVKD